MTEEHKEQINLVKFTTLFLGIIISLAAIFFQPEHMTVRYDCGVAEISPDYPQEVKQRCRRMDK
jgi:hypothetical protein